MAKLGIYFWTGTGNTEAMAESIAKGAKAAGAEVEVINISEAKPSIDDYELLALGCPAMGDEVLEEDEFEPFFQEIEGQLKGRKVLIFGSYSWNDGEWMLKWAERLRAAEADLFKDQGLISYEQDALDECEAWGKEFAQA